MSLSPQWRNVMEALSDPAVSEVTANGPDSFFVSRGGTRYHMKDVTFKDVDDYMQQIGENLIPLVRSAHDWDPNGILYEGYLSARIHGKKVAGRCTIVLPPACLTAQICITNRVASLTTLEDIASTGSMSTDMLDFIKAAVDSDLTIAVSGSTGAGKTTLMEACTKRFSSTSRIGVAEDMPELHLVQPNVSYLNSVPWKPGMKEEESVSLTWVVQQYQRLRVDKVIVGEVRGKEFADFLIAANSGLGGSMITLHAEDPQNCLNKMTEFALAGAPGRPIKSINSSIANTIDIIIQMVKTQDKRRRVSHIQQVTRTVSDGPDAKIVSAPLYLWDKETDTFSKAGNMEDSLRQKMTAHGIDVQRFLTSEIGARYPSHGTVGGITPHNNTMPAPTQAPAMGTPATSSTQPFPRVRRRTI